MMRQVRWQPRALLGMRGFTLIEIMVSLAIVSIALLAGSQAVNALSRGAQRQSDVLLAQLCAENELIKMRLSKQMPNVGDSSATCEQAGKTFTINMEVRGTPNPSFRRVDAKVLDDGVPVLNIATIVSRY
jgi:general secretion pathway protein I